MDSRQRNFITVNAGNVFTCNVTSVQISVMGLFVIFMLCLCKGGCANKLYRGFFWNEMTTDVFHEGTLLNFLLR